MPSRSACIGSIGPPYTTAGGPSSGRGGCVREESGRLGSGLFAFGLRFPETRLGRVAVRYPPHGQHVVEPCSRIQDRKAQIGTSTEERHQILQALKVWLVRLERAIDRLQRLHRLPPAGDVRGVERNDKVGHSVRDQVSCVALHQEGHVVPTARPAVVVRIGDHRGLQRGHRDRVDEDGVRPQPQKLCRLVELPRCQSKRTPDDVPLREVAYMAARTSVRTAVLCTQLLLALRKR
eukprot:607952-Prymnesium_polylepis.2